VSTAVVATAYGGPEVLAVIDESLPAPGPGEVLVDVRAIGVNQFDAKSYSGSFGDDPAKLPMRLGNECSGVVASVAPDAVGPMGPIHIGDEVIVFQINGAYASQVLAPVDAVVRKPSTYTFEQSAGFLLTGVTAAHMVIATAVSSGDTVLIHAASGGVGQMATQQCLARGARVIGTAPESMHELLRSWGAIPVVFGDGLQQRVVEAAGSHGVDVALDCVGVDEALEVSLSLVANRDRIVTIANWKAPEQGVRVLGLSDGGKEIRMGARPELVKLADEGKLSVTIDRTFRLADAADAHRYLSEGKATGKVVLLP